MSFKRGGMSFAHLLSPESIMEYFRGKCMLFIFRIIAAIIEITIDLIGLFAIETLRIGSNLCNNVEKLGKNDHEIPTTLETTRHTPSFIP